MLSEPRPGEHLGRRLPERRAHGTCKLGLAPVNSLASRMSKLSLVVGALSKPKRGQLENGDTHVVRVDDERHLLAIIDGLGHGPKARAVARAAEELLAETDLRKDVLTIMNLLHGALRGTRGAAAMLCILNDGRLSACGVGNVELRVVGSKLPIQLSPGILGTQVRKFRPFEGALRAGDRLVLFSDGISSRLPIHEMSNLSPAALCEKAHERYGHDDDATIVVADVLNAPLV
jgi:negative regulator of sigma-B (phosphoserine phosphatase)